MKLDFCSCLKVIGVGSADMRIRADALRKFERVVAPPPPPIQPVLSAVEEAALIASKHAGDPVVAARRARALTILRRAATPEGEDAELVALLAAAAALPIERRDDRLAARQQLVGIGRLPDPPREVRKLMTTHGVAVGDGPAFADALFPPDHDGSSLFHEGDFGSNPSPV